MPGPFGTTGDPLVDLVLGLLFIVGKDALYALAAAVAVDWWRRRHGPGARR